MSQQNTPGTKPIGIILANTGSPSEPTPESVHRYLSEYLMDNRIIQMPRMCWKTLLNHVILPKRQYTSAEKYQTVWMPEGSPLLVYEQRLSAKLEKSLNAKGRNVRVRPGMSYGASHFAEACHALQAEDCGSLIILPTYPQSATCITESVRDSFQRVFPTLHWAVPARFIANYSEDPVYRQSIADSIRQAGFNPAAGDRLMFDFHSIPKKDREHGDTYTDQIERDMKAVTDLLGALEDSWSICFSSVFGPHDDHWVGPLAREVLADWGRDMAEGRLTGRVFFATPGFSVDCLETLWDIPQELEPAFVEGGGHASRFVVVPPLNDSDAAVATMEHVLFPE